MSVNQERLALGTAALRSGEYPQARGCLRSKNGYCCLGVLTEVAIANGLQLEARKTINGDRVWSYGVAEESGTLPNEVAQWYGFATRNPHLTYDGEATTAIGANDSLQHDFAWIADAFDATYATKEEADAEAS